MVIEINAHGFNPEYTGKLNFDLSVVNDLIRQEGDNPTIGILLCLEKKRAIAEYVLRDIHKPIGVSEYQRTKALSEDLKGRFSSIEEIERIIE